MEGVDKWTVRTRLQQEGLAVLAIEPGRPRAWPGAVRRRDLAVVFRTVAIMVADGVPIERAFGAGEVLVRGRLRLSIQQLRTMIREGHSVSEALEADPRIYPRSVVGIMRAGEHGSRLEEACRTIADQLDADLRLRTELWGALTYPMLVLAVGVGSIIVMGGVVVPRFAEVFEGLGSELPAATQALLTASDLLRRYGAVLGLSASVLFGVALRWSRNESARRRIDALLLRLPIIGGLRLGFASARTCRALGGMLGTGMPLLQALDAAREATGDFEVSRRLARARESVARGNRLSDSLAKEGVLTPFTLQLVGVGEAGGRLGAMATRAGDIVAERTQAALRSLVSLVEPLLIIALGGMVAGVSAALLQAVYSVRP
jgi:type II secretory pathway component PulF